MALIKESILSKSQLLNEVKAGNSPTDHAQFSLMAYMLADGAGVKVYDDRAMGVTVVEYDDGR